MRWSARPLGTHVLVGIPSQLRFRAGVRRRGRESCRRELSPAFPWTGLTNPAAGVAPTVEDEHIAVTWSRNRRWPPRPRARRPLRRVRLAPLVEGVSLLMRLRRSRLRFPMRSVLGPNDESWSFDPESPHRGAELVLCESRFTGEDDRRRRQATGRGRDWVLLSTHRCRPSGPAGAGWTLLCTIFVTFEPSCSSSWPCVSEPGSRPRSLLSAQQEAFQSTIEVSTSTGATQRSGRVVASRERPSSSPVPGLGHQPCSANRADTNLSSDPSARNQLQEQSQTVSRWIGHVNSSKGRSAGQPIVDGGHHQGSSARADLAPGVRALIRRLCDRVMGSCLERTITTRSTPTFRSWPTVPRSAMPPVAVSPDR